MGDSNAGNDSKCKACLEIRAPCLIKKKIISLRKYASVEIQLDNGGRQVDVTLNHNNCPILLQSSIVVMLDHSR